MLDTYFNFFRKLNVLTGIMQKMGFPPFVYQDFGFKFGIFFLVSVVICVVRFFGMSSGLIDKREDECMYSLVGFFGGSLGVLSFFFGFMVFYALGWIPLSMLKKVVKFDGSILGWCGNTLMALIVLALAVAVIVIVFLPAIFLVKNNIEIYGFWGIFETIYCLFIGHLVYFIIGAFVVGSIIACLPVVIAMLLYMTAMKGLVDLILGNY